MLCNVSPLKVIGFGPELVCLVEHVDIVFQCPRIAVCHINFPKFIFSVLHTDIGFYYVVHFCSPDDSGSDGGSDVSSFDGRHTKAAPKRTTNKDDKKPVKLDPNGIPYGNMREVLAADIKRYAKDLDPTTSWEGQPGGERRRFFRRLYSGMKCPCWKFFSALHTSLRIPIIVISVVLWLQIGA